MAKSTIRAPKIPKGEDHAVTIRNQENQINLLIHHCEELKRQVDAYAEDCRAAEDEGAKTQMELEAVTKAFHRLQGWQDCAREMLSLRTKE